MSILRLARITKTFGETRALRGVDFELQPAEVHALVGENGAGKSTLIRILAGDFSPESGEIMLEGTPSRFQHPREAIAAGIGFVHQRPAFVPDLSITENFLLGLPYRHRRGGLTGGGRGALRAGAARLSAGLRPGRV